MAIEWVVLNIGAITRNKFWGESDDSAYRQGILCTSTLIMTGDDVILVDPSVTGEQMNAMLDARRGIKPDDVTKVFMTHTHGDHLVGAEHFKNAELYMPEIELKAFIQSGFPLAKKIKPAEGELSAGVSVISMPGHTKGLGGLLFEAAEGMVAVTGDGVMTKDFFKFRAGYYNSLDFDEASRSIEKLAKTADIVVPGHDNYFIVSAV